MTIAASPAAPSMARTRHTLSLAAMDGLATGFALIDAHGNVIDSNAAFRELLGDDAGLVARLRRASGGTADTLDRALAGRVQAPALIRVATPGGAVIVHLLPMTDEAIAPGILLVARHAGEVQIPAEWLVQAFGLAPREAEIGRMLARGRDIQQVARDLDIAVSTARVHLRNIFRKTGTGRQTAFLTMIVSTLTT